MKTNYKSKFKVALTTGIAILSLSTTAQLNQFVKAKTNSNVPTNLQGRWLGSNKAGDRQFTKMGKQFLLLSNYTSSQFKKRIFEHRHNNKYLDMRGVIIYTPNQTGDHKLNVKLIGYKNGNPVYQLSKHSPLFWTQQAKVRGKYRTVLKSLSNGKVFTSTKITHHFRHNSANNN